jgi:hypothetical protein
MSGPSGPSGYAAGCPASCFSLASGHNGDSNPQDLVTDGTSFWVVDGTARKVFKYTLSGSLLGSWAIDPADAHSTGISINPTNVSDAWIVDSGTLKVYQYVGAAGRTAGNQTAAATFALAAGDTNPQGIADPPPADLLLSTVTMPPLLGATPADVAALFPAHADGALPSAAVLGQAFAGSQVPAGPGWVWGSDMLAAFLSLSRKDSQGNAWGF